MKLLEKIAEQVVINFKKNNGINFNLFVCGKNGVGMSPVPNFMLGKRNELLYGLGQKTAQDENCPIKDIHTIACAGEAWYILGKLKKGETHESKMQERPSESADKKEGLFIASMKRNGKADCILYDITEKDGKRILRKKKISKGAKNYAMLLNEFWKGHLGL